MRTLGASNSEAGVLLIPNLIGGGTGGLVSGYIISR